MLLWLWALGSGLCPLDIELLDIPRERSAKLLHRGILEPVAAHVASCSIQPTFVIPGRNLCTVNVPTSARSHERAPSKRTQRSDARTESKQQHVALNGTKL